MTQGKQIPLWRFRIIESDRPCLGYCERCGRNLQYRVAFTYFATEQEQNNPPIRTVGWTGWNKGTLPCECNHSYHNILTQDCPLAPGKDTYRLQPLGQPVEFQSITCRKCRHNLYGQWYQRIYDHPEPTEPRKCTRQFTSYETLICRCITGRRG